MSDTADHTPKLVPPPDASFAEFLWYYLWHPWTRYAVAWLIFLACAGEVFHRCWYAFDTPERGDGNSGHAEIDFGGQWLMGRMLVKGHLEHLFDRRFQAQVLFEAYPEKDGKRLNKPGEPERFESDARNLLNWVMGRDGDSPERMERWGRMLTPLAASGPLDAALYLAAGEAEVWTPGILDDLQKKRLGGPLYPPVQAFYMAPLGLMEPRPGYRVQQVMNFVWIVVAGFAISYLSKGRFWCPLAALVFLYFPGFRGSACLGQNAPLSLAIVAWGWALTARGRPIAGGIVWGFLAFKPVWALVYLLTAMLARQWRTLLAMMATGAALCLLTVPWVGIHGWLDWLKVGKEAAVKYDVDENWVKLSRDLLGFPRRNLLDWKHSFEERHKAWLVPTVVGWAMLVGVLELTTRLVLYRRAGQPFPGHGPGAAFLLLGTWTCCYHFMYYDVLLAAVPVCVLFASPAGFLFPRHLQLRRRDVGDAVRDYHRPALPQCYPEPAPAGYPPVGNSIAFLLVLAATLCSDGLAYAPWLEAPWVYRMNQLSQLLGSVTGVWFEVSWDMPWEQVGMLALWLWCGWVWVRNDSQPGVGKKIASDANHPLV